MDKEHTQGTSSPKSEATKQLLSEISYQLFKEQGFAQVGVRDIAAKAGMTTGAFYGYYKSKEGLFEALVGEHYAYLLDCFQKAQKDFANLPHQQQPEVMGDISGVCMFEMLHYAYEHLEECKLILCCSEGTKYDANLAKRALYPSCIRWRYYRWLFYI